MYSMDAAVEIRRARLASGLSQRELARRAQTSQATVSAYEAGRKQPSVRTLQRLLRAAGAELVVRDRRRPATDTEETGRRLAEVMVLAEALPFRRGRDLRFPRLPVTAR
jgi:transcriptional regulator with XRE-family HTH domain